MMFKGSSELSVGLGTFHVTFAYDSPESVGTSMLAGHGMLGGWMSVEKER